MKVYIGKVPREKVVDAERSIIHAGIRALDGVEKVRTEEEADIIIYSQRYADHHCGIAFWQERYASTRKFLSPLEIKYPEKTVIMDYADDPLSMIPLSQPVKAYYKRSLIAKSKSNEIESYENKEVKLLSYSVRSDFLNHVDTKINYSDRKTDVSCFFPIHSVNGLDRGLQDWHGAIYRAKVTDKIIDLRDASLHAGLDYDIHVGLIGQKGRVGRDELQKGYFDKCKDSKIIVHCQPYGWEGDFRTFEALASGALVISDKSYSMPKHSHPLVDGVHLVEYDRNDLDSMLSKIIYYLKNPDEAAEIAKRGQEFVLKHHTPAQRMKQIINIE